MRDLGQADVKWCVIIGDGENLQLQRRPRCDLALLLWTTNSSNNWYLGRVGKFFKKKNPKWTCIWPWDDVMLRNLSSEGVKWPFLVVFKSPCAVNTRITYEFHSLTTWQRELVSQLTSIPQQEIQAEKRDIKKKKKRGRAQRKKEGSTYVSP